MTELKGKGQIMFTNDKPIAYFMGNKMYTNLYYYGGTRATGKTALLNEIISGRNVVIVGRIQIQLGTAIHEAFEQVKPMFKDVNVMVNDVFTTFVQGDFFNELNEVLEYANEVYKRESEKTRCDWQIKKKISYKDYLSRKQNRKLLNIRSNC